MPRIIENAQVLRIEPTLRICAGRGVATIARDGTAVLLRLDAGDPRLAAAIFDELLTRLSEGSMRLQVDIPELQDQAIGQRQAAPGEIGERE